MSNSMLPKRRFWKAKQTVRNIFSTHFSTIQLKSRTHVLEKCVEKMFRTVCSAFQNLRLGVNLSLPKASPNEDFGRTDKR